MSRFAIILLLLVGPAFYAHSLDYPPRPNTRVNDYAGILTPQQKPELESLLRQHEKETSNQIVVAIFPSLEEESLEDYANRLFEKWTLGTKEHDNGVLLAVFLKERQIRIEIGYGLEGKLTDALSSRIIRDEMGPEFRAGRYAEGITKAVLAIRKVIAGEYKPAVPQQRPPGMVLSPGTIFFLTMAFLYVIYRIRNRGATYIDKRGRKRYRNRDDGWFIYPGGLVGPGGGWDSGGGGGFGGGDFSGGGGSSGGGGASGSW